jgi:hypothetical protein
LGKARAVGNPGNHVLESDAREDGHAVPGRLAVERDLIAALLHVIGQQLGECSVRELGLLEADDIGPPLVQPGQQAG